jgi:hypothetical protein
MPDPTDGTDSARPLPPDEVRPLGDVTDLRRLLQEKARVSKRMSWLLDECIRIPGTEVRFGIDPLLGLIPYGGETVATVFGTLILADAGKKGLPLGTLVRMGGNMILNAAIGAIPFVGDLFSFWFKSNTRNYQLVNAYLASEHGHEARGGWWPVILIASIIGTVLVLNVLAWILFTTVLVAGWHHLFDAAT